MKRPCDAKSLLKLTQAHVRRVVPDADLTSLAVSFMLIRAADRLVYDLDTVHREVGWTWPGFRVLFWLWLLGPLEQREIASLVSASGWLLQFAVLRDRGRCHWASHAARSMFTRMFSAPS
jgi:hypothetical protein